MVIKVFGVGEYGSLYIDSLKNEALQKIIINDAPCGFGNSLDTIKIFVGDKENFNYGSTRQIYYGNKNSIKLYNIIFEKIKPIVSRLKIRLFKNSINIFTFNFDEFGCAFINQVIEDKEHTDSLEDDTINIIIGTFPLSINEKYNLAINTINNLKKTPQRKPYINYNDPDFDLNNLKSEYRKMSLTILFDFESIYLKKEGSFLVRKDNGKKITEIGFLINDIIKIITDFITKLSYLENIDNFKKFIASFESKRENVVYIRSLEDINKILSKI